MNLEALRQILCTRFVENFKKPAPLQAEDFIATAHENQPFTQPTEAPWARFSIAFGDRGEASIGTERERIGGVIFLQLFAPKQTGTKTITDAADKLAAIFDNWQYQADGWDIEVRRVTMSTIGETKEGWLQKNASVAFRADKDTTGLPALDPNAFFLYHQVFNTFTP